MRSTSRDTWTLLGVFTLGFLWFLRPIWGIDVFFHIAIGREIVAAGIPSTDILSAAHPDAAWTPFQVGYALIVHALNELGGLDLVRLVHATVFGIAFTLLYRLLKERIERQSVIACLMVGFLILFDERIRLRPHLFNLLFEVALLLPLASRCWRSHPKRWLWVTFGCALSWTFIHAMGVLWLIAVLGALMVTADNREDRNWTLQALGLSTLAIVCVPGGIAGIVHVMSIQADWLPFVPELAPSWTFFKFGTAYGFVAGMLPILAAVALLLSLTSKPPRDRWGPILVAAGFAFASLWMIRLAYYAVFVIVLIRPELGKMIRWQTGFRWGALAIAAGGLTLLSVHVLPRFIDAKIVPWTTSLHPGFFPEKEVAALEQADIGGKVFNAPSWGGYVLYKLYPRATVISDGRVTFTKDVAGVVKAMNRRQLRVKALEFAHERYGIDLAIWPPGVIPPNPHWKPLLVGKTAVIYGRNGPQFDVRKAALNQAFRSPITD